MHAEHPLIAAADGALREVADPAAAVAMAAYMKTTDPFFGVAAPARRAILRQLLQHHAPKTAEEYRTLVTQLWGRPEREMKYLALDVAQKYTRFIDLDALPLYERLVREGAWWDLVDPVASNLIGRLLLQRRDEMTPVVRGYIEDEDLWIRRTAIIAQIKHRSATDAGMLFDFCLRSMSEKDFFIRKAIGWALRAYSASDPDAVHAFLEEQRDNLSGLSYREGAKHLRRTGRLEAQ